MSKATVNPWNVALRRNDVQAISHFLADGVDVNEPISWDPTYPSSPPLCIAALSGEADGVRLLLAAGADPNAIEQPAQEPKPGWLYSFDSPLHYAAGRGNAESVTLLLDAGADANYCSSIRDSALHDAIVSFEAKRYYAVVTLLLDRGCAPDFTPTGRSLLSVAAANLQCRGVITELVRRGADPNALDPKWGCVPLHRAIEKNNPHAVRELLEAGADPTRSASPAGTWAWAGLTPSEYAKKLKRKKLADLLEQGATPAGAKVAGVSKKAKTAGKAKRS